MAGLNIAELSDFTGGLNFRADQFQLSTFESPDMLNVEIDPRGGIFSRGGMHQLNPTEISGTWEPHRLYSLQSSNPAILLANDVNAYWSTGGDFTKLQWDNAGTPTDVASTGPDGCCMAQWGDLMYISGGASNGAGGYTWKTGDTYAARLTASGTNPHAWQSTPEPNEFKIPSANHLMVHANKMFAAHTNEAGTEYKNRIRWSLENVPFNWNSNHYIDLNGGGDGITGMAVVSGQLIIFKPNAIYVLFGYDTDSFQVVELTTTLGVLSHESICNTEEGVYFYSHNNGLYYYNGSSLTYLFDNLKPAIELNYINPTAHEKLNVSFIGRRVWIAAPFSRDSTVSEPTVNFVFDPSIRNGVYTQFQTADGFGLTAGTNWSDSSNNDYRLLCHPTKGYILKVDLYDEEQDNIDGTPAPFVSYYKTRWFDGGTYLQKKMFRRPDFVIKESALPQNITVKVYHDFTEGEGNEAKVFDIVQTPPATGLIWGSGFWGEEWSSGAISSTVKTGRNLGLARAVQLEFIGPPAQLWGVNSIGYKYQARRVKG
jgi:hypothetical protein